MIRATACTFALTLVLGAGPALAATCAGAPSATRLTIIVDGVKSDRGLMTATLYPPDNDRFLKPKGEITVWRVPAKAPDTEMCVYLPGPGEYAVAIYDDLNSNLRFDHSMFAPLEPYGFSNDPRLFLGPPSVSAARFEAGPGETTIHIRLRYPNGVG
jgi:uncharacterized protein (DUF2141 family)